MQIGKKNTDLLKAITELKEIDYSKYPELKSLYERLVNARKQMWEFIYETMVH